LKGNGDGGPGVLERVLRGRTLPVAPEMSPRTGKKPRGGESIADSLLRRVLGRRRAPGQGIPQAASRQKSAGAIIRAITIWGTRKVEAIAPLEGETETQRGILLLAYV